MSIHTQIAAARKAKGLRQADLAEIVAVHKETISHYERGVRNPSPAIAQRIGAALGVDLGVPMPRCAVAGCDRRYHARSLCTRHYVLARSRGYRWQE